jgi:FAD/FMN-containing dehydrogenase
LDLRALSKSPEAPKGIGEAKEKGADLTSPAIKGRVVTRTDHDYDEIRKNYNSRFNVSPKSILLCSSEEDVIKAVKWARKNKSLVSLRSGGHSYESFSLIENGAVIDVGDMANISVDSLRTLATVQTGATLLPLCEALWQKRVVIPVGSCATVGIAGVTLGGGYGLLARSMGLTCDNLVALRMVDAQGDIVIADDHQNSDLLWACRGGGGGNFGVATEFTFRLHKIENVSIVRIRWKWQQAAEVIRAWQDWAYKVDDRMTGILTVASKGSGALLGLAMFVGPPNKAQAILAPLIAKVKPAKFSVVSMPFIKAQREFSGLPSKLVNHSVARQDPPPEPVHLRLHERFKGTSDYLRAALDDKAVEVIIQALSETPSESSCIQFDSYGGAINKILVKDSAFCHRADTRYCLHYQISWRNPAHDAKNVEWINNFRKAMSPYVSGYCYQNYCDRDVSNWKHAYYGDNLSKLISVKQKYDPDNLFHSPQSLNS